MTQPAVEFRAVDIIFGRRPRAALALLDAGRGRDEILAETGQVVGVAGASLAVEPGRICVLMGLSGSGKSTLLRAVNRLNVPTRGDVLVRHGDESVNVSTCDRGTLRRLRGRGVAMVFQQFALLPWRSVRDNVGLGLELRGLGRAERARVVDEKLAMVGLSAWADRHAQELSGGMQQRVGLARAFATDADVLLMDEPFSALDPLIRAKLQDELLDLQARLKKTILFVSHDLDEAVKLGDRIVIMEGGRIVQAGSVPDIVMRPATPYVADFVRHLNPLTALEAGDVMRPLGTLPRRDADILPDGADGVRVALDGAGRVCGAALGGAPATVVRADDATEGAPAHLLLARADTPLKRVVHLRHLARCPLLVVDEADRVVGTIGEADILRALVR